MGPDQLSQAFRAKCLPMLIVGIARSRQVARTQASLNILATITNHSSSVLADHRRMVCQSNCRAFSNVNETLAEGTLFYEAFTQLQQKRLNR